MPGTKEGGLKARDRNLARDPEFYKRIGRLGGKAPNKTPKGFAANRELASSAGKIGGAISKRGSKK